MYALIAWSPYWWHLETSSSLATSSFLPGKGNRKGNCFNQPVGYSHMRRSLHQHVNVGLMHIQLVLQSPFLQNRFLVRFHHCCAVEKVVPGLGQPPNLCLLWTWFPLSLFDGCCFSGQKLLMPSCSFNGDKCYTSCSPSVLTPFQIGQSQFKQFCSFLWSLSLLFTQPF